MVSLSLLVVAENCTKLMPSTAAANYRAIKECLYSEQQAVLGPGTFLLPHGLRMPENSSLTGDASSPSRLLLAVPTAITSFFIQLSSQCELRMLLLDAGNKQKDTSCCRTVVRIAGNNSLVQDVKVTGSARGVGIYFDSNSRSNLVFKANVYGCYYGVVFSAGLSDRNTVEQSTLEHIACDAVSFLGYGHLKSTLIQYSGSQCMSGTAGAGLFCKGNAIGALIESSVVSNTCGMSLDVDSCAFLVVRNSTFGDAGYDWESNHTHCWGMPTAVLLDSQMCSLTYSTMWNTRPSNQIRHLGDAHGVYSPLASSLFSDFPDGNNTVLNFGVLHRPNKMALPTIQNQIINNSFSSRCDDNCTGIAYFAGRGTGNAPGSWEPSDFRGNTVTQSDIGSVRCGENAYASEALCSAESLWPCNEDDYLHPVENFRNDDCKDFVSEIQPHTVSLTGQLRSPLPLTDWRAAPAARPATAPVLSGPPRNDWIDTGSQALGMSFHFG